MARSGKSNKGGLHGGADGGKSPSTNLWVGNLSQAATDSDLADLFGRIGPLDSVNTYSTRSFAYVYFKRAEDASTAMEALQGYLLHGSPLKIEYARPQSSSGGKREKQPSNTLWIGYPPSLQIDEQILHNAMILFGEIVRIKSFPSRHYSFVQFGSVDDARRAKEGLQGRLFNDPRITILYSSSGIHDRHESFNTSAAELNDPQIIRESKRARKNNDFIWRGTIAKGGTPVCHARCVPIGNGIEPELPEVVNCSARTGLDMLAKHYAAAPGFDIMFFLPDSEADFASYTEFLRYLGSKSRAGVAKFPDGTTLFLVPPSDFLTNVLNVKGPERLYGVVLKLPQLAPVTDPAIHLPLRHPIHAPEEPKPLRSETAVSLTPELIATLKSILPIGNQNSGSETSQVAYKPPVAPPHGAALSSPQPAISFPSDKATSDTEVDKNQRYQSTLQFAANLLKKLQQQPGL